jgi:hypothetical protein
MDITNRVLSATSQYMQLRETWRQADEMEEILEVTIKRMSPREFQAYTHVTGVWDIANNVPQKETIAPEPPDSGPPSLPFPRVAED